MVVNMTAAPFASTIVSIGLIPVAFLFSHTNLTGRKKGCFHPVSGTLAIICDLVMSINYMLCRSFSGAVDGSTLQLTPAWTAYFGVHEAITAVVMLMEIAVLAIGISMV